MLQIIFKRDSESIILGTLGEGAVIAALHDYALGPHDGHTETIVKEAAILYAWLTGKE